MAYVQGLVDGKCLIEQAADGSGASLMLWIGDKYKDVVVRSEQEDGRVLVARFESSKIVFEGFVYYMVVEDDKHSDDEYHVFKTLDEAREKAEKLVAAFAASYEQVDNLYRVNCTGKNGLWFSVSGEDSFTIHIEEIEVPFENSVSS